MPLLLDLFLQRPCSSRYAATLTRRATANSRCFSTSRCWREDKTAQPQTPATETIELAAPVIYISESHDPWFNLSFEDWLLRSTVHHQPVLFLYRNTTCVVIGRNQNPWKETTPRKLRSDSIPLIRRRSGGGTVYHARFLYLISVSSDFVWQDLGNTNFSIILPRLLFTRAHGAELVARAIRDRLGIEECGVSKRNDVVIRDRGKEYKVSGSAYKIIQHRAYHHGTMLISSSLAELGKSLKSSSPNIETKGIPSFPSPVTTLNTYLPAFRQGTPIKHEDFVRAVTKEFEAVYSADGKLIETHEVVEARVKEKKVLDGADEVRSWEWQYGQTPEFTNEIEGDLSIGKISVSLTSRHALMTSASIRLSSPVSGVDGDVSGQQGLLDALALDLIGKRYETLDGLEPPLDSQFDNEADHQLGREVIRWLRTSM